jgi:hypothetical protein
MRITLVVTCIYAGVALSAPVQQATKAIEAQNQWSPYLGGPGGYEDSDDDSDTSWVSPPWAKPKPPPRLPSYYSASQAEPKPGLFSFLGMGSQGWGSRGASAPAYPAPLSPQPQSCETPSSNYLGGFLRKMFGGGKKDCSGVNNRPAAPFAAFAPQSPYAPYAPAPVPRPLPYGINAIPSPVIPKPSSSLVPWPKSIEAPSPKPSPKTVEAPSLDDDEDVPVAPKPTPQATVKPSPLSSAAAKVPTLAFGSHSASPKAENAPAVPSPVTSAEKQLPKPSALPSPVTSAEKKLPTPSVAPLPTPNSPSVDPVSPTAPLQRSSLWQPQVAEPFQIILSGHPDINEKLTPEHVNIFDIDLFNTPTTVIKSLRSQGKKVICYFSAGSAEDWRPDYSQFPRDVMGSKVSKDDQGSNFWEGEKWVNIKNPNPSSSSLPPVWKIMRDRIKMAAEKGCNAIDPDNVGMFYLIKLRVQGVSNDSRWLWK